jgi:hypothetical protein
MKILLSYSRNIGNQDQITKYLGTLDTEDTKIKRWVFSVLKNYLVREYGELKPHRVLKKDPAWMQRPQSEPIMDVVIAGRFQRDIEHALGYLRSARNRIQLGVFPEPTIIEDVNYVKGQAVLVEGDPDEWVAGIISKIQSKQLMSVLFNDGSEDIFYTRLRPIPNGTENRKDFYSDKEVFQIL